MAGLGLGWVSVAAQGIHPALLAKSGGGAGFMSYIAFAPGRDTGVFVAVNRVDVLRPHRSGERFDRDSRHSLM